MQKSLRLVLNGERNRICDIVAETLVEEYTRRDANSRCRLSVFGGEGMMMIAGSVQSRADLDIGSIVTRTYNDITGRADIEPFVHISQTPEERFNLTSWRHEETGVAYGFATRETPDRLPLALVVGQQLKRRVEDSRLTDPALQHLGADGEILVTMDGARVAGLQLVLEHPESMKSTEVRQLAYERIVTPMLHDSHQTRVEILTRTSTGGGFSYGAGASGVNARMTAYGGLIPDAGHSFIGHDVYAPVRLAHYEARRLANYLLQKTDAPNVLVQLPYEGHRILTDRVYAVSGKGENLSAQIQTPIKETAEVYTKAFDLVKAPLKLLAEHHVFVPELAPWEMLIDTLEL